MWREASGRSAAVRGEEEGGDGGASKVPPSPNPSVVPVYVDALYIFRAKRLD